MVTITDRDGDSISVSDATADMGAPSIAVDIANPKRIDEVAEVWLTIEQARNLAGAINAYADIISVQYGS